MRNFPSESFCTEDMVVPTKLMGRRSEAELAVDSDMVAIIRRYEYDQAMDVLLTVTHFVRRSLIR